jgi:hypothetical protein
LTMMPLRATTAAHHTFGRGARDHRLYQGGNHRQRDNGLHVILARFLTAVNFLRAWSA